MTKDASAKLFIALGSLAIGYVLGIITAMPEDKKERFIDIDDEEEDDINPLDEDEEEDFFDFEKYVAKDETDEPAENKEETNSSEKDAEEESTKEEPSTKEEKIEKVDSSK